MEIKMEWQITTGCQADIGDSLFILFLESMQKVCYY